MNIYGTLQPKNNIDGGINVASIGGGGGTSDFDVKIIPYDERITENTNNINKLENDFNDINTTIENHTEQIASLQEDTRYLEEEVEHHNTNINNLNTSVNNISQTVSQIPINSLIKKGETFEESTTLLDTFNNVIYPKSKTNAIFDENGNRLDNILSNMKGNIYSLEEVEIGSYLDSKLYRKVFNLGYNFTISDSGETTINISIDNLSRIINASFIIENITTQLRASNPTMLYRNDTGTFLYKCYSRFNGSSTRNVKLVVEYTKTV